MASVSRSTKGRDGHGQRSDVTIVVTGLILHLLGLGEYGVSSASFSLWLTWRMTYGGFYDVMRFSINAVDE